MKMIYPTALICFLAVMACTKKSDHVCTCERSVYNPTTRITYYDTITATYHDTRENALAKCKNSENSLHFSVYSGVTCSLAD